MKQKKIIVLMGGPSAEGDVSRRTGAAILAALQAKGYQAEGMELNPATLMTDLKEAACDVVFIAIHGKFGEDGAVQGTLEMMGIPYTGSGVMASAVAMDKAATKDMFIAHGVPTPRSVFYDDRQDADAIEEAIRRDYGVPVVIKAVAQGSSIGVSIVTEEGALRAAIEEGFRYSEGILVEQYIKGRELTVAVWDDGSAAQALPVVEIRPHSGAYDYASKYTSGATDYLCPAPLTEAETQVVQDAAIKAFRSLRCGGIARADVLLDAEGRPYVLEVNTIPGMTATSLVPKAAAAAGISFEDLCEKILLSAIR